MGPHPMKCLVQALGAAVVLASCVQTKVVMESFGSNPPYATMNATLGLPNWVFVGKFAYDAYTNDPAKKLPNPTAGDQMKLVIEKLDVGLGAQDDNTVVLAYDDQKTSWAHIYENSDSISCASKIDS